MKDRENVDPVVEEVTASLVHPQIAVDNGFGGVYGHQKADWMVDVVQQYFLDNGEGRMTELTVGHSRAFA